ncbi:MAG: T9SS type A sorting domain-containing protein [Ignavibacteria bacterium]|nr:T9SS type A sorting domain-containing protein [Ignavibacteria bacterium]MBK9403575.1 T9SS type A sorting domain-containing protein [Ignavibacteria bacterium]
MKNFLKFLKRGSSGLIIIALLSLIGTEIFQGQGTNYFLNYDESDPNIDRPTKESLQHFVKGNDNSDLITDAIGFDNFEIGIDNAEQMIVSNPRNPLNMQFGVNGGSGQNAYYTLDGHNWTVSNPSYHPSTCCDPWSAFDSLGVLHYGSGVSGQYIYKSTNGGQNFGTYVLSVNGNDRNTLAADQTNGPYSNYLYAAITPGNFARSTDRGATWTQTYASSNTVPGVMIAVGPNGPVQGGTVIYVTNTGSAANCTYTFHKSTDGGLTLAPVSSLNVAGYVGTLNSAGRLVINNGRTRPYPMIAMDNSYGPHRGRLYLVYASNEPVGNGNKPDVILQYSDDQATTWSSRIRVNDNANPELSDQWFPAIWCEKETGRLYIKWYDTRENPATFAVNVYATYTDDGVTFAPNQKLTTQSWTYPTPACSPNSNCYRGDYDGMTANPVTGFALWYDGRSGNYKNIGSYFPDFAMKINQNIVNIGGNNDSATVYVSVPAVKLYSNKAKFTATVSPTPAQGNFIFRFKNKTANVNQDSLTSYPDSLRFTIRSSGGITQGAYTVTVQGNGPNGTPVHRRTITVNVGPTGIVNIGGEVPSAFSLSQNYPNPFNPTTNIKFDVPKSGNVKLNVYDMSGKVVQELVNTALNAGAYSILLNAVNLSSGTYFYRLESEGYTDTKKLVLIK